MSVFLSEAITSISFGSQEIKFKCRILHIPLVLLSYWHHANTDLPNQQWWINSGTSHCSTLHNSHGQGKGIELNQWSAQLQNEEFALHSRVWRCEARKLTLTLYVQLGHWQRSPKPFFLTEPSKTIQKVKEYLQQMSKDSVEKFIMVYLMFKLT